MIKPLLVAVQFLTRLPVPHSWLPENYDDKVMGQSVLAYPLVGLIIGIILWAVAELTSGLPLLITAAVLLLLWVLLTGALHLDGLADCADAWVGGHGDRQKILAIMKDSFIGPVGVAVVVAMLLLKFAALASLPSLFFALVITPFLSRAMVVLLFLTTPYVREQGLGQSQSQCLPRGSAWLLLGVSVGVMLLILGYPGLWLLLGAAIAFVLLRYVSINMTGGMTGDTAGAILEISEAIILVLFVVLF